MAVEDVQDGLGSDLGIGQSADSVPMTSSKVAYLTVPESATFAPFASFRNQTLVFDENDSLMCTHVQAEMPAKFAEMNTPQNMTCAASPGGQGLPAGIDNSWFGYEHGGCGTWATAVCNRVLGDTPPGSAVTKDEWEHIAIGIHMNDKGASQLPDIAQYYTDKGYCAMNKRFDGTPADYEEMTKKHLDGCDIKLAFWRRNPKGDPNGDYSDGHIETVTGATQGGATTNSWGKEAVIEGGSKGGFSHSEDGKSFSGPAAGGKKWPANSTEVQVLYVCKCTEWEELVKKAKAAW